MQETVVGKLVLMRDLKTSDFGLKEVGGEVGR